MTANAEVVFVASDRELIDLAATLRGQPWIVVDTEFLRERTYFPQLCLIQVAAPGILAGVDALAIDDWSPMAEIFRSASITKVFHAARQDVEVLWLKLKALPQPIFDTQIVATLMHGIDQISYAALVQRVHGITLAKSETRTDWSRRPLLGKQWEYALDDVRYLAPVYQHQLQYLSQTGRLAWFDDDFATLNNPATYEPDFDQAWRRIREASRLTPRARVALQALAAWREKTAIARDLPRRWVIDDATLLVLAQEAPTTTAALARITGLPGSVRENHGDELVTCIDESLTRPEQPSLDTDIYVPLNSNETMIVAKLRETVEAVATREGVPTTVLASRSTLESVARTGEPRAYLRGWRSQLLIEPLRLALTR